MVESLYATPIPSSSLSMYLLENLVPGGEAVVDVDPGIKDAWVTVHGDDGGCENEYGAGKKPEEAWHDKEDREKQDKRLAELREVKSKVSLEP